MTPTVQTLALVAAALLLALLLRALPVARARDAAAPPPSLWLGEKIEALALKLLLPLFVFEALSRDAAWSRLALATTVGFALPPLCLLTYAMCRRMLPGAVGRPAHGPEIAFLAASFGGGNRGTALLVVLLAGAADFSDQLQWFALVDLGNFIFMLTLMPLLLARHYGARHAGTQRLKAWLGSYLFATVAVVAVCWMLNQRWSGFAGLLAATAGARKALFTLLVFTALGLRFRLGDRRALGQGLVLFVAVRVVAALALVPLAGLPAAQPLLLPLGILLLMPPSSILPSLIARTAVREEPLVYASSFAAAANLLYLVTLALAGLLAALR